MSESRLELRSWGFVALGYLVAPVVSLTVLWLYLVLPAFLPRASYGFDPAQAVTLWWLVQMFGGSACLIVEILVVTPILQGFRRYRWPWLNGWSAAAIGFALGALPWLILNLWPASGPGQDYVVGNVPLILDGKRTWAGWTGVFRDVAMMGSVGLVAAITFRFTSVRRRP